MVRDMICNVSSQWNVLMLQFVTLIPGAVYMHKKHRQLDSVRLNNGWASNWYVGEDWGVVLVITGVPGSPGSCGELGGGLVHGAGAAGFQTFLYVRGVGVDHRVRTPVLSAAHRQTESVTAVWGHSCLLRRNRQTVRNSTDRDSTSLRADYRE